MNLLNELAANALCCALLWQALPGWAQSGHNYSGGTPASQSTSPIFVTPPAPEYLADILFKPRYRNAAGDPANDDKSPRAFAMLIHFAFDSTRIEPASLAMLDSIGQMLQMPRLRHEGLVIEGHTDAAGGRTYNEALSEARALAIRTYLADSFALDPERLVTVGYGKSRLHDPSKPFGAANRRVSFRSLRSLQVK